MVTPVVMPQMGLEVTEGIIAAVHVAVGALVTAGEPLLEVETDKALADVVAPRNGFVTAWRVEVGDAVPVGATLLELGDSADEALVPTGAPAHKAAATTEEAAVPAEEAAALAEVGAVAADPRPSNGGAAVVEDAPRRIRAAPVARRAAAHHGIALESIEGTGPRGRVTLADVERARDGQGPPAAPAVEPAEPAAMPSGPLEPMSATRRAIARRMTASQLIPQFTLDRDVDASWLLAEKTRLSADGPVKVGINDLLMHALADTVARHIALASSFVTPEDGGQPQLHRGDGVDVGLAVAHERGLLVPVIRGVDSRTLGELVVERARLVAAARSGRLAAAEMSGATVSLSSLAAFGIDRFNAMINPGESSILAVGRTVDKAVPRDRGFAVVPTMTLSLTLDHRVVDGAVGAAALRDLAELLEGAAEWRT